MTQPVKDVLQLTVTILTSGALFSFLQYLLNRHDNKKNVRGEIEKKIDEGFKEVKAEFKAEMNEVKNEVKDVKADVGGVSERLAEHEAITARTHILRFADELQTGTHSKEYFQQQLKDIKTYKTYCDTHPDFENNLTTMSSKFIQEEYERLYLIHNDTA